jgi:hypothetical protein
MIKDGNHGHISSEDIVAQLTCNDVPRQPEDLLYIVSVTIHIVAHNLGLLW